MLHYLSQTNSIKSESAIFSFKFWFGCSQGINSLPELILRQDKNMTGWVKQPTNYNAVTVRLFTVIIYW